MSKIYTVSELGEVIGVPRTTINDYLSRYGQYIEFEQRGKRRVYTQNAVTVLQEICKLRNENHPFSEIENLLMQKFPVHAEPHQESKAPEAKSDSSTAVMDKAPTLDENAAIAKLSELNSLTAYITKAEQSL